MPSDLEIGPRHLPPAEVIFELSGILYESIARIRSAASGENAEYCWEEAYHIHNLPNLIRGYQRIDLERYLKSARGRYTNDFQARFNRLPTEFIPYWERLEAFLERTEME